MPARPADDDTRGDLPNRGQRQGPASIQTAIDGAPAGATIDVARGTYQGDLEIVRSVHLVGDHAVIVPAAIPTTNLCQTPGFFGGVVGVCIHGVPSADFSSITPISSVSFEGFTVVTSAVPGSSPLAWTASVSPTW